jgi:Zn-finger protein
VAYAVICKECPFYTYAKYEETAEKHKEIHETECLSGLQDPEIFIGGGLHVGENLGWIHLDRMTDIIRDQLRQVNKEDKDPELALEDLDQVVAFFKDGKPFEKYLEEVEVE